MKWVKYILLCLGAIVAVFPLYWMVVTALSQETWIADPQFLPIPINWEPMGSILIDHPFARWTFNTGLTASMGTLGNLFFASLAAFAFACLDFRGRDLIFYILLLTMIIPGFLLLIPRFFLISRFGWINTYQGIFVPWWFHMFTVFLLRQYFLSIPHDLIDASRMDGANLWQVFWKIVAPSAKPVFYALFVITFLRDWNVLMWPMIVIRSTDMQTLSVGMSEFYDFYQADYGRIMAGSVISLLPIFVLFIFFQKHVEKGIKMGIKI